MKLSKTDLIYGHPSLEVIDTRKDEINWVAVQTTSTNSGHKVVKVVDMRDVVVVYVYLHVRVYVG